MYADVIVDISLEKLDKSFQYHVPAEMRDRLKPGMAVAVPFGKGSRRVKGFVLRLTEKPALEKEKIKDILAIDTGMTSIESRLIALAFWMREQYGSTMNQALKTVLPVKAKIKEKQKKTIVLSVSRQEAESLAREAGRKNHKAKERLLAALLSSAEGSCDYAETMKSLQLSASTLQALERDGCIRVETDRIFRGPDEEFSGKEPSGLLPLSKAQQQVADGIWQEFEGAKRTCLLHGVTGSGKTLVYLHLMQKVLDRGEQVIVLIPEIALTYQTLHRFYQAFGEKIAILHSRMSAGERYDQMEKARAGLVKVMLGPRSALFTPFPNLGLVIIDEEHEGSYKSEIMPRYHAREVAMERGRLEDARLLLGSATPSVESYYRAKTGEYALFTLTERYAEQKLPVVHVTDMRQELKKGNRSIIGSLLQEKIEERLRLNQQVMLFLNRRGYAGFVSCRSCGFVAKCPHCDVSMSLHNGGRLICHYCGYETGEYRACPSCGSPFIGGFKAGTQQIEKAVKKMFPQSRVLRMDFDTTRKKEGHSQILRAFENREADILVGTQMIVKGHDFPHVTLVGVLAADLSLNESDYRSGERTFQLLTQAVGRSGRGRMAGEAVIQTYQPEHYSIVTSAAQDYGAFYEEEILYRRIMGYPPLSSMLGIFGGSTSQELLTRAMGFLLAYIKRLDRKNSLAVIGPAPEAVGKVQDVYRQVIYVRHPEKRVLTVLKNRLEEYIEMNRGFHQIHIQFDFHL